MQQTNFIDKGLTVYGGPFFRKLRVSGDKGFLILDLKQPEAFDPSVLGEFAY
jgi:hypothetical protein